MSIVNPFKGLTVGWSWAEHVAAGFAGGTDYVAYFPFIIRAAASGRVTKAPGENGFTGGSALILTLADGTTINYRETGIKIGFYPRNVKQGAALAFATRGSGRWPHIDATVNGVRVPFETLLTSGTTTAGTGTVTPINATKRKNDMTTLYHDVSTKPLLFALAGDSPGTPANWLTTTDSGLAKSWAASHGNSCGLSHGSFVQFGVDYTAPLTIKP